MSKKRYLEAEMLKEFLRMGMKVGHIHTLQDADADRLGRIIVWGAAVKHVDITYWENAIFTLWTFRSGCRCL